MMRSEFESANARLVIVSGTDQGSDEFIDAVWKDGELYIDDEEAFKDALGGVQYKNWWLLKPKVASQILSLVKNFGQSAADVTNKKTQKLGGTLVIKAGQVIYQHHETSTFDNGSAKDILAAIKGDIIQTPAPDSTPVLGEVAGELCSRDAPDACAR